MKKDLYKKLEDYEKSVHNLLEVLHKDMTPIEQDAAIKRFELAFETCWKVLRGIIIDKGLNRFDTPKDVFKYAVLLNWIDDENVWLEIIKTRNLTVHTYNENLAQDIILDLPRFSIAFNKLLKILKIKINE